MKKFFTLYKLIRFFSMLTGSVIMHMPVMGFLTGIDEAWISIGFGAAYYICMNFIGVLIWRWSYHNIRENIEILPFTRKSIKRFYIHGIMGINVYPALLMILMLLQSGTYAWAVIAVMEILFQIGLFIFLTYERVPAYCRH